MKKMIMLFSLLFAFSCEDKDDSFSIIGKWQYTHILESSGEWQIIVNGDRFDFKESGMVTHTYFEEGEDKSKEVSYTYRVFDRGNISLTIDYASGNIWTKNIVIESNEIMIWKPTGPSYESEGTKLKKI